MKPNPVTAALPQIGLFVQLKAVITEHPSPVQLQTWLLEHLYDLIRTHLEGKAEGMRLLVDRHLAPGLRGVALVDAIHSAHEELLKEVKTHGGEAINEVYAAFVEEWCQQSIDQHMVRTGSFHNNTVLSKQCTEAVSYRVPQRGDKTSTGISILVFDPYQGFDDGRTT